MANFRIARLLGAALTISVMTSTLALPVMAAEETAAAAEGTETDSSQETGTGEAEPEEAAEGKTSEQETEESVGENPGTEKTDTENAEAGTTDAESAEAGTTDTESAEAGTTDTESAEAGTTNTESAEAGTTDAEDVVAADAENEEEETDPASDAADPENAENSELTVAVDAASVTNAAALSQEVQETVKVEDYNVTLTSSASEIMAGKTAVLTAKITFTAYSEASFEATAAAAVDPLSWKIDGSGAAVITKTGTAQTVKTSKTVTQTGQAGTEETVVYSGTITQAVTITGKKEGTATVSVTAGEKTCSSKVKVKPIPVALGKTSNICWRDTTVLTWNKVSNAGKYRVVVSVYEGTTSFSGALTVTTNACDVESKIVGLINAHKKALTGASYSVRATVQAISTDAVHYKNGAVVTSPVMRYLKTTYQEAVSRNGWFEKGGEWYFYEAGKKQTGWFEFDGKKYFLYSDGRMAHDCWVGKRYLKSGGEMAKDEWVDNFKYYVDKNGNKADKSVFVASFFYKTSGGWHYKRTNGKPEFKNTWAKIFNRMYYFDANGNIKTGFFTVGGKKYFSKYTGTPETGLGARQTGWVVVPGGTYWLDDNGVMQKNKWVDKKQYYVGANGRKVDWITYNNLRNVNTSNRLGYYIYNSGSAPEQSIAGYDVAYKKGNRIMVIDLRFTKDNVPVCFHDDLVSYARNKNGSVPGSKPSVSGSTLSQLNNYDYGIKWGNQYKGTKALTLEEMAKWIAKHSDTELYIEVKADKMNATQINKTVAILNKYKIVNNASMVFATSSTSDTRAKRVHNAAPTLRIGFTTSSVNNVAISQIKSAKGANNEVFMWCWDKTALSASKVNTLRYLDVQYECGSFSTLDEILKYYAKGSAYVYNSGVETEGAVFHQLLRTATMHEGAKWESTSKGWKYKFASGVYARSRWVTIKGKNYYFTKDAIMRTGWMSQGGKLYYFNSKGWMATGKTTINGHVYQFASNGAFIKKIK